MIIVINNIITFLGLYVKQKARLIMSKWTEIRDNVVDAIKVDDVTEDIKQTALNTVVTDVLPALSDTVDNFINTLIEQSQNEAGWCRVRDRALLPFIIKGGLSLISYVASKTLEKTENA